MSDSKQGAVPPRYRLVLNWDGDDAFRQSEAPMSKEKFDEVLYGGLEGVVDCMFWNGSSGSTAFYPSDVLEFKGDADGGRFDSVQSWRSIANAKAMIERGEDPNETAIEGARKRGMDVFFSFRMNDQHQDSLDTPQMKRDHPEWLLGDKAPAWFNTSWDYTHLLVREHRLAMVKEVVDRYDFDGIELDWQRHAHHLPVHQAFRRRYVLTDFMRQVRQLADEASSRRGRKLYLAARVSASLEGCLHVGYDIEQWVAEGLIDFLIPAACAEMDSSLDGGWWTSLCRDTPIRVNPSLGGWFYNETHGTTDQETYFRQATRALAARLLSEGVDGLYLFNWYTQKGPRRGLMAEIRDPALLHRATKTYITTARSYRAPGTGFAGIDDQDRIYGEVPVELHPTSTDAGPTVAWNVVDDAPAADAEGKLERITLRFHLRDWSPLDKLTVNYDGVELVSPQIRNAAAENEATTSEVSDVTWMEFDLNAQAGATGEHIVGISLQERNPQLSGPLVLLDVDLEIVYAS